MDEKSLYAFLGQLVGGGAVAGALVFVLWKVLSKVADRFILALDALSTRITEHTTKDLEHHAEVKASVVRLEGKMDGILDWQERTPVEQSIPRPSSRERTGPVRTVEGEYGPGRPGTGGRPR